jgi:hypothetical protein
MLTVALALDTSAGPGSPAFAESAARAALHYRISTGSDPPIYGNDTE